MISLIGFVCCSAAYWLTQKKQFGPKSVQVNALYAFGSLLLFTAAYNYHDIGIMLLNVWFGGIAIINLLDSTMPKQITDFETCLRCDTLLADHVNGRCRSGERFLGHPVTMT
jgi:hypothetical protein